MHLSDIVILFVILSGLVIGSETGIRSCRKISDREQKIRQEYYSSKFISESFRNTCEGKGFKDLNEWQKTCRVLWNLDYIGWCNSEDFLEVTDEGNLFYGKWIGKNGSGEVYARVQKK